LCDRAGFRNLRAAGSDFLAIFMVVVSFTVLSFWFPADPPPARARKLNGFVANIAIVGGLIYVVVVGRGRFSFAQ
jgi:uncharacterized membrane protein YphA (DoxX/SURF4 family)